MVRTLGFHYGLRPELGCGGPGAAPDDGAPDPRGGPPDGRDMSLVVDEGLTPLLGFSAPNRAYPLVTHPRGFVAHLVYGVAVAVTAETIDAIGRHGRRR